MNDLAGASAAMMMALQVCTLRYGARRIADLIFGSKEVVSNGVAIFPDLFSVFDSRPYECRLPGRGPTGLCDQVFGA